MSAAEREESVARALAAAEEVTQQKLASAADRAAKDKQKAIDMAVKKALAEAQKGGE